MHKWIKYFLFVFVLIAVSAIYHQFQKHQKKTDFGLIENKISTLEELPFVSNCSQSFRYRFEFQGKVLRAGSRLSDQEIVQEQLKYLFGYFHAYHNSKFTNKIYPSLQDLDVQIEKKDRREITYRAAGKLLSCHESKGVEVLLPTKPFQAYQVVSESQYQKLSFGPTSRRINPCNELEMVDINDPKAFWYTWNPLAQGQDVDGQSFDCRNFYKEGRDYHRFTLNLKEESVFKEKLEFTQNTKDTLRITLISGVMQNEKFEESNRKVIPFLKHLRADDFYKSLSRYVENEAHARALDMAIYGPLHSMMALEDFFTPNKVEFVEEGNHFLFKVTGETTNDRSVEIDLYHGFTNADYRSDAIQWKILADSFSKSDVIIYIGHAGYGANMRMTKMMEQLNTNEATILSMMGQKRQQMIVIISCYASGYFGEDIVSLRKKIPNSTTDVLLSTGRSYLHFVPIAILKAFDLNSEGAHYSLQALLQQVSPPGEYITVNRYRGSSVPQ